MAGRVPPQPVGDKGRLAAVPSYSSRHLTMTRRRDSSVLTVPSVLCLLTEAVPWDCAVATLSPSDTNRCHRTEATAQHSRGRVSSTPSSWEEDLKDGGPPWARPRSLALEGGQQGDTSLDLRRLN